MVDKSVGQLIRAKRKELGWTIVKLSRLCFVSVGHLNNVECGIRGLRDTTKSIIFKVLKISEVS